MSQTERQEILDQFLSVITDLSDNILEHARILSFAHKVPPKSNAYKVGLQNGHLIQTQGYNLSLKALCDDFNRTSIEFVGSEDNSRAKISFHYLLQRGSDITKLLAENSNIELDLIPSWLIVNSAGELEASHPSRMETGISIKVDRLNMLLKKMQLNQKEKLTAPDNSVFTDHASRIDPVRNDTENSEKKPRRGRPKDKLVQRRNEIIVGVVKARKVDDEVLKEVAKALNVEEDLKNGSWLKDNWGKLITKVKSPSYEELLNYPLKKKLFCKMVQNAVYKTHASEIEGD